KTGKTAAQDARVAYIFKDASGQRIGNWPQVPRVRSDTGWVLRTSTADVPAGAKSLYIQLAIFNATGQGGFADVNVVPQAPTEAAAATASATTAPSADVAAAPAAAHGPTVAGAELIANGNMEGVDAQGTLAGWTVNDRYKAQLQVIDEQGNHFVRL